jgi:hypothetical protein
MWIVGDDLVLWMMCLLCPDNVQKILLSCVMTEVESQTHLINLQASVSADKCRNVRAERWTYQKQKNNVSGE